MAPGAKMEAGEVIYSALIVRITMHTLQYIPHLFNQPEEKGIMWVRHPEPAVF